MDGTRLPNHGGHMSPRHGGPRRSVARKLALAPLLLTATAIATLPAQAATSGSSSSGDSSITGSLIVIDGSGNATGGPSANKQAEADRKAAMDAAKAQADAAKA